MAVNPSARAADLLQPRSARLAGIVSLLLALLGAAALVVEIFTHADQPVGLTAVQGCWAGIFVLAAAAGAYLYAGRQAAQKILLSFWLVMATLAVVLLLRSMLWSVPQWWQRFLPLPVAAVALLLAGATAVVVLLIAACPPRSRLRYATLVSVSVAAAVTVAVAVNMIAQKDPVRRDFETLGRYGLSQRTKAILDAIHQPVRLSCLYSGYGRQDGGEYRSRVLELLEEMAQYNGNVKVVNASSDVARARLLGRLRRQAAERASQHARLLSEFQNKSQAIIAMLQTQHGRWAAVPEDSYLAIWPVTGQIASVLGSELQKFKELRAKIARQLSGSGLPDYAALVADVRSELKVMKDSLQRAGEELVKISKVPATVSANRDSAMKSLDECLAAVKAMSKALGSGGQTSPAEPSRVLGDFIAAAQEAVAKFKLAAKALSGIAGKDNAALVRNSRWFALVVPAGAFELRTDLVGFLEDFVIERLKAMASQAQAVKKMANAEYQRKVVNGMRRQVTDVATLLAEVRRHAQKALKKLSAADDEPTRRLLAAGNSGKYFSGLLEPVQALLEQAEKLPELKGDTLSTDITEDNIVIVEAAGKTEVVRFDEVWPLKVRRFGVVGETDQQQRVFNGDSAISSKLLAMTHEPFATVLLTYFEPKVPPQMSRMVPPADITPRDLSTLRRRLEQANFKVELWNLIDEMPADVADGSPRSADAGDADKSGGSRSADDAKSARPVVLLILPPPPPAPPLGYGSPPVQAFGDEHLQKIRKAIDSGIPAVFLSKYLGPIQMGFFPIPQQYKLNDYLEKDWGIRAATEYRLVAGVPDETVPGRFQIDVVGFSYLPLSAFTNHPIGRPLRARRLLWFDVCPIRKVEGKKTPPAGVRIEPVLRVPAGWRHIWASRSVSELVYKVQTQSGGLVRPDFGPGKDLSPPLDVAVAATRSASEKSHTKAAKIVVLGVGGGLMDGYLDKRVPELNPKGGITFSDPPRANADLLINSLYWLIGRGDYIASGPAQIKPVEMIEPRTMLALRVAVLVGLPLLVLCVGGVVMLMRRR